MFVYYIGDSAPFDCENSTATLGNLKNVLRSLDRALWARTIFKLAKLRCLGSHEAVALCFPPASFPPQKKPWSSGPASIVGFSVPQTTQRKKKRKEKKKILWKGKEVFGGRKTIQNLIHSFL